MLRSPYKYMLVLCLFMQEERLGPGGAKGTDDDELVAPGRNGTV